MKLRDFVANSLPRVRGRKKKGQTTGNGAPASITAAVAAVAAASSNSTTTTNDSGRGGGGGRGCSSFSATSPNSPDSRHLASAPPHRHPHQDRNGNWFSFSESRFGFLEKLVGKDSPVKRLLETKDRRSATAAAAAAKSDKKSDEVSKGRFSPRSSSPRFCPSAAATEPSSPYGSCGVGVRSPPLGEKPVFHSQHASPVSASWAARDRYSDWDCASLYAAGYGYGYGYPESVTSFCSTPGSQRGPRSRSRIRTNPWLPSPRPTPYSVRSLSSPSTSSRSPSPSSSPAPPSSSDNSTSPLTSFSSDVRVTQESQLQRHRRHRRHHSEVKASDLTRHHVFDPPLTDTEQYYSTLDSGIGDTATSSGERDRHKAASRKQRHLHSKRRSAERDTHLKTATAASSSPKSKPKFRSKTRSSHPPGAFIANRDSKYWDSDSSSRSPPRTSRSLATSKDSLHFDSFPSETRVLSDGAQPLPGTPREAVAGWDFFYHPYCVDSVPLHPSSLSACEDIGIITSNIEQLAQNISSEYEEGLDLSLESMLAGGSKQDGKGDSLRDLYNLDSDSALILPSVEAEELCPALDYKTFAEPLHCGRFEGEEGWEALSTNTTGDTTHPDPGTDEDTSTVDVAVQTDFADDEEEDISGSDFLISTESGSDWVTTTGSSSDWPTSGASDWQTGSGCATEEEEEEEEDKGEEESTLWVEGSRLWIVPDVMQNSTDTGYSSLSRDGRLVTDDNNNNHNNNNNNSTNNANTVTNAEDSSDSSSTTTTNTTTTDDKMAKTSDSDATKPDTPSSAPESDLSLSGAVPKTRAGLQLSAHSASASDDFDSCGEQCRQGFTCKVQFNIVGGRCGCSRSLSAARKATSLLDSLDLSQDAPCDVGFSVADNKGRELQPTIQPTSRTKPGRRNNYDHVVPYPYDVRRFSDVILPYVEREGSVSPSCLLDDDPSGSEESEVKGSHSRLKRPTFTTSTPRCYGSEAEEDDFTPSFPTTSTSSDLHDVTSHDAASPDSSEEAFESPRPRRLPAALLRKPLPLRSCEDLALSGRPLPEVRASLEEKVHLLRQGKRLVSRKIREAREEEMIRQQQKLRFQRLLDIHRKRILLETLQDLRQRLESQSARLQASYSTVLNLQKRCVRDI